MKRTRNAAQSDLGEDPIVASDEEGGEECVATDPEPYETVLLYRFAGVFWMDVQDLVDIRLGYWRKAKTPRIMPNYDQPCDTRNFRVLSFGMTKTMAGVSGPKGIFLKQRVGKLPLRRESYERMELNVDEALTIISMRQPLCGVQRLGRKRAVLP